MSKLKTLVIDESRWARGGKNGPSSLLNDLGAMCCLGFLGKACGAAEFQLEGCGQPGDTCRSHGDDYWSNLGNVAWPNGLIRHSDRGDPDTQLSNEIVNINDDCAIDDADRKKQLAPLFRKLGYRIEYVGGTQR